MNDHAGEPLCLLVVHAHPDDECLGSGATLARYAREGVRTVLVTATKGEEGEIHDPDLVEEEARPRLAEIREEELRRAVAILGIAEQEFLGYRDSGMVGTPANAHPDNFHNADLDEATGRLVRLIRRHRPQVVVTYNEDGGYGHPDHLQCYRVTLRAFDAAGDPAHYPEAGPAWQPAKLYATAWSRERWTVMREEMRARGLKWPFDGDDETGDQASMEEVSERQQAIAATANSEAAAHEPAAAEPAGDDEEQAWGQPEATITTFIDTQAYWQLPREALREHRTQFAPDSLFLNLPDDLAAMMRDTEFFILKETRGVEPVLPETDLFAEIRQEAPVAALAGAEG